MSCSGRHSVYLVSNHKKHPVCLSSVNATLAVVLWHNGMKTRVTRAQRPGPRMNGMWRARPSQTVRGWYIAMGQYTSLCEGAAVVTLGVVDFGDRVPGRVQVECGREETETNRRRTERGSNQRTIKHTPWMTRRWNETHTQTHWVARLEPCSVICM